ncbi:cation diffusion facilitator family transporter [Gordonia hydrophobica]|uniref:Cation diffusion facilitator family transporter n=1 Tax=Gordonia hydrophobica TaxID=40516 RepID=A0ABZ2U7N6_9ACTN|nr:cation diffusion facilitator family transporter [Gordonia hydrophobica]MBM7366153.1 cobalt-zinc-cadmium efflux system protein [Gordonia hydrophobica]
MSEATEHGHSHGPTAADLAAGGGAHRRIWPMVVSLGIIAFFFVVELITGILFGSLALIADAGHMATDLVALSMGLLALLLARHGSLTDDRSFGWYRAEVFTAVVNAVLLLGVGAYVLYEAVERLGTDPEVPGGPMIVVALLGLAANVVVMYLLRADVGKSLAVRGAYLEVLADAVGSVGVLVAGVVAMTTGWGYADLIVAVLIALWVVPRAVKLAVDALKILNQQAPKSLDLAALRIELEELPEVQDVHDLHVWSVTSGMDVATVHLSSTGDHCAALTAAQRVFAGHGLAHATVQVERPGADGQCESLTW